MTAQVYEKRIFQGRPDEAHISTSYIERQNLTMRMGMRWFARLTNVFSKAGIADRVWTVQDIAGLLDN